MKFLIVPYLLISNFYVLNIFLSNLENFNINKLAFAVLDIFK